MTTPDRRVGARGTSLPRQLRPIHFAPLLALLAFAAWAFASPVGAGPDDDYHLVSTWCAAGGSEQCEPGDEATSRNVSPAFSGVTCFAQNSDRSAMCQADALRSWDAGSLVETSRGNFSGEYPAVYYTAMRLFAGEDIQVSALAMRLVNATLFVGLATALTALLPIGRRRTLLLGWLVTLIPLGIFLIPSNNPSGWAVTGVGTAFLALLGWFDSDGRRRWALGALYLVGIIMAGGARGDAAIYAIGATVTAVIITFVRTRSWARKALLPAAGLVLAVVLLASSAQAGVGATGFSGGNAPPMPLPGADAGEAAIALGGYSLAAYNLLMLPFLWTGVWGTWALGWIDTMLPAIVPWAATSAFVVTAFVGVSRVDWRKVIAAAGVLFVLIALPVYVLTAGGNRVGEQLQPRYLLPLIVLFALVLLTDPAGRGPRFTRIQLVAILGALAIANTVALQVDIRRYVTGADVQGPDLAKGAEWWWAGMVSPNVVWIAGTLAFAALVTVIGIELRRLQRQDETALPIAR
jgi:hypothetical protein